LNLGHGREGDPNEGHAVLDTQIRTGDVREGAPRARADRVLDPLARTSEVLFGLIMALTFTGTLSAATAGHEEVRTLLIGAIGCNIAWGLVDAVMFLLNSVTERGRGLLTLRAVHQARSREDAQEVVRAALPPAIASALEPADVERLRERLVRTTDPLRPASLTRDDLLAATAVFLLVVLSTFPVVIPFLVFSSVHVALRTSNLVAIVMLFGLGYSLGQYGGLPPWRTGSSLVLLGLVLVGIAIALGG
jgi:hypothetical protein